jgi:bacillithiol biosynthesis deacetylase BshB1
MTEQLDILAFGAHPDDVELSCGGTIAKEVSVGKKVGIVDLTRGELGTRGSADLRAKEARQAASILGVSVRENLGLRDGFFKNDEPHQLDIIKILRKYRPNVVLCNAQTDRHIDHGRAASLVHDACFLSGLRKIETFIDDRPQKLWRPSQLYHYIQWNNTPCDFVVDISDFIDKKMAAILSYGSQFYDEKSKEPDTPISSQQFLDSIQNRAADLGRIIGVGYAEGFTTQRQLAVAQISDLI